MRIGGNETEKCRVIQLDLFNFSRIMLTLAPGAFVNPSITPAFAAQ
jgi:hypothetical protein